MRGNFESKRWLRPSQKVLHKICKEYKFGQKNTHAKDAIRPPIEPILLHLIKISVYVDIIVQTNFKTKMINDLVPVNICIETVLY